MPFNLLLSQKKSVVAVQAYMVSSIKSWSNVVIFLLFNYREHIPSPQESIPADSMLTMTLSGMLIHLLGNTTKNSQFRNVYKEM